MKAILLTREIFLELNTDAFVIYNDKLSTLNTKGASCAVIGMELLHTVNSLAPWGKN